MFLTSWVHSRAAETDGGKTDKVFSSCSVEYSKKVIEKGASTRKKNKSWLTSSMRVSNCKKGTYLRNSLNNWAVYGKHDQDMVGPLQRSYSHLITASSRVPSLRVATFSSNPLLRFYLHLCARDVQETICEKAVRLHALRHSHRERLTENFRYQINMYGACLKFPNTVFNRIWNLTSIRLDESKYAPCLARLKKRKK